MKQDFGFDGFVVSDWGAQHGAADFANGGLDMEMEWKQNSTYFDPQVLGPLVNNGSVPQARLDDMVRRILIAMYATGIVDNPPVPQRNKDTIATSAAHTALAKSLALSSLVLLKNAGGLLPFGSVGAGGVVVVGDNTTVYGTGSGSVVPPYIVTPYDAIRALLPLSVKV
jgi:beta-glucosidase